MTLCTCVIDSKKKPFVRTDKDYNAQQIDTNNIGSVRGKQTNQFQCRYEKKFQCPCRVGMSITVLL